MRLEKVGQDQSLKIGKKERNLDRKAANGGLASKYKIIQEII